MSDSELDELNSILNKKAGIVLGGKRNRKQKTKGKKSKERKSKRVKRKW